MSMTIPIFILEIENFCDQVFFNNMEENLEEVP